MKLNKLDERQKRISRFMSPPMEPIDEIIEASKPVFRKYGIRKVILFGSFARERQSRRSDVDLILIQETDKRYLDRFEGILSDLYKSIRGRDLEVFIYTPEEFENIAHRKFIQRAVREGKVIYES